MPEAAIPLKPKIAIRASLRQAVEWIGFNLPPLEDAYDRAMRDPGFLEIHDLTNDAHIRAIEKTQHQLFTALREGHLIGKATQVARVDPNDNFSAYFKIIEYEKRAFDKDIPSTRWDYKNTDFIQSFLYISGKAYQAFIGEPVEVQYYYTYAAIDITIGVQELFKLFPSKPPEPKVVPLSSQGYTTPYIQLMLRAINELSISANNQPPKKNIEEWFLKAAPALSQNEAGALATFVRSPDMKKGGWNRRIKKNQGE